MWGDLEMIKLILNGEKVVRVQFDAPDTTVLKSNEVLVSEIPHIDLLAGERAYIYYINDNVVVKKA